MVIKGSNNWFYLKKNNSFHFMRKYLAYIIWYDDLLFNIYDQIHMKLVWDIENFKITKYIWYSKVLNEWFSWYDTRFKSWK